jgi:acetoin utilization deacetylase AcuC-like enzyme
VLAACRERGIPVAVSMAGGYGTNIDDSVAAHLNTLEAAFESWQRWRSSREAGRHPSYV